MRTTISRRQSRESQVGATARTPSEIFKPEGVCLEWLREKRTFQKQDQY